MQIIAAALVIGCVTFLTIAVFMVQNNQGRGMGNQGNILSLLAVLMLAAETPVALILPRVMLRASLARLASQPPNSLAMPQPISDEVYLVMQRQNMMIVSMAMFEGAAFFATIAYLIEGQPLALVASAVAIVLQMVQFPTEGRVSTWLEQQLFALNDLRGQKGTTVTR
jgi:hypothetical protein